MSKKTSVYEEGCLSLPGHFAEIERPECQIKFIDYNGKEKELKATGLLATCIQHEVDHLNGVLFIDYLSKLKKDMIVKKLINTKKNSIKLFYRINGLKIIFMGTPNFAVPILKAIHKSDHKILEVYTQPPTKSGRGQKINRTNIHNYSEKLNLKLRCPTSLETNEEINHIKKLNPDVVVVVAYGKILPTEMLNIDNILFINIHASLLPR